MNGHSSVSTAAAATSSAKGGGEFRPVRFFEGKLAIPGADPTLKHAISANYSSTKKQHQLPPHVHQAVYYNSSVLLAVDRGSRKWTIPSLVEYTEMRNSLVKEPEDKEQEGEYYVMIFSAAPYFNLRLTIFHLVQWAISFYHLKKERVAKSTTPPDFRPLFAAIENQTINPVRRLMMVSHPMFHYDIYLDDRKHEVPPETKVPTDYQKNVSLLLYYQWWWHTIESHTPAFLFEGYLEYFLYCVWTHGQTPTGLPMTVPTMTQTCHSRSTLQQLEKEARRVARYVYGDQTMHKLHELDKEEDTRVGVWDHSRMYDYIEQAVALDCKENPMQKMEETPDHRPVVVRAKQILTPEQLLTHLMTTLQLVTAQRLRGFIAEGKDLTVLVFDHSVTWALEVRQMAELWWPTEGRSGFQWMITRYRCPIEYGLLKTAVVIERDVLDEMHLNSWMSASVSPVPLWIKCLFDKSSPRLQIVARDMVKQFKSNPPRRYPPAKPLPNQVKCENVKCSLDPQIKNFTMKQFVDQLNEKELVAVWTTEIHFDCENHPESCWIPKEIMIDEHGSTQYNSILMFPTQFKTFPEDAELGNTSFVDWWWMEFCSGQVTGGEFVDLDDHEYHFRLEKEDTLNDVERSEMEDMMSEHLPSYTEMEMEEPQYQPPSPPSKKKAIHVPPPPSSASIPKPKPKPVPPAPPQLIPKKQFASSVVSVEDFSM